MYASNAAIPRLPIRERVAAWLCMSRALCAAVASSVGAGRSPCGRERRQQPMALHTAYCSRPWLLVGCLVIKTHVRVCMYVCACACVHARICVLACACGHVHA